jgi:hypothetical protein
MICLKNRPTVGEILDVIALNIFEMLGDYQASAVTIGEQVREAIRGASPRAAEIRVHKLAAMLEFPACELTRCHQAYLVAKLTGEGLTARLPLGAPLDLYVQLFRIARSDGNLDWKKDSILRIAEKVGRGLPTYRASGLVDAVLATNHGRRNASASQGCRMPDVGLSKAIETMATVNTVA